VLYGVGFCSSWDGVSPTVDDGDMSSLDSVFLGSSMYESMSPCVSMIVTECLTGTSQVAATSQWSVVVDP